MAKVSVLLNLGQSNGGAHPDYASWQLANDGLAIDFVPLSGNSPTGAYLDTFTMPGTWPTRHATAALKGCAIDAIRILQFWNPGATGLAYTQYPHRAIVSLIVGHTPSLTSLSLDKVWQFDPTGRTVTRSRTGTTHTITAWGGSISPSFANQIGVVPAFDPPPEQGEQIGYRIFGGAVSPSTSIVKLDIRYGGDYGDGTWSASLAGLRLRCVAGTNVGVSRSIDAVTLNGSVQVEVSTLTAWPSLPQAGDEYVIEPHPLADGTPVPFEKFGLFLPYSPFEGLALGDALSVTAAAQALDGGGAPISGQVRLSVVNSLVANQFVQFRGGLYPGEYLVLSADGTGIVISATFSATTTGTLRVFGKQNPFPPGFSFPSMHCDVPVLYQPFRSGTFMYGGAAKFASRRAAFHTTLANLMQDELAARIYVVSLAVDGSSLLHNELTAPATTDAVGWFDPRQQLSWMPGEANGIWQRFLDVLDSAKEALAREGNTGEVVLVTFPQGEADAAYDWSAPRYRTALRAFKSAVRAAIKNAGLCEGDESEIPFVHPRIREAAPWTYASTVNAAIVAEADADDYGATVVISDLTVLTESGGNVHYDGTSATLLASRIFDAWLVAREGPVAEAATPAAAVTAATPQAIIAAIDAAIVKGGDVAAYTVNGRTVQMRSWAELLKVRDYYVAQIAKASGLRTTKVRFSK
jgi:hypothetical protein